ncbi:hypothetical protein BGX20_005336, partial [Mortierella sp. AD010]
KTRYGQELYNSLKLHLSEKARAKDIDYSPHYYYMLLDFDTDVKLSLAFEASLDTETILGLRLAYTHFFRGKYDEGFPDFRYQALKHDGLFTITNVIIAIREDLNLSEEQPFFLFLHIDGFQRIFSHSWKGASKSHLPSPHEAGASLVGDKTEHHTMKGLSLFQDMMHTLGSFMSGRIKPHMIQTFLSGTAAEPEILNCIHQPVTRSISLGFMFDPRIQLNPQVQPDRYGYYSSTRLNHRIRYGLRLTPVISDPLRSLGLAKKFWRYIQRICRSRSFEGSQLEFRNPRDFEKKPQTRRRGSRTDP